MRVIRTISLSFLFLLLPSGVVAQDFDPPTRVAEIEQERLAKAQKLSPDAPAQLERAFNRIQDVVDRLFGNQAGFRPVLGNLATGSGFAAGVEYYRPYLARGNMAFRSSLRGSFNKYWLADAQLSFPDLARGRVFAELYGVHHNYPSINYYGPGPDSKKTGRSDFLLEDTSFDLSAGVRPMRHLRLGVTGGYLAVNVGPGRDDRFASAGATYSPAQAPGIQQQSNFLRGGPFIQYDYRDKPGDPHRGGNYTASYIYYDDLKLDTGNHRKLIAEAQQYIPFLNEKRVIALRARTELSYRNTNQVIPFYLQPVLGGSDDLRGFRPFRFYDNNSLIMNAEYRWEVMTGFDMAVFADAGKVFHRHADLDLTDLETSAGFGLRFKTASSVIMRWDVGFSREGFQVWLKFNNVF